MVSPKFIEIDGKRFVWRDLLLCRREQLMATAKTEQPSLFEFKEDRRPVSERTVADATASPACSTRFRRVSSSLYCAENRASSPCALKMSQSPDPAPATNPAILCRKFNELWISRSSRKSVVNKINGLREVGSNHTQPTHSCQPLNTHQLSVWKSATAAWPWHRELLFMPEAV